MPTAMKKKPALRPARVSAGKAIERRRRRVESKKPSPEMAAELANAPSPAAEVRKSLADALREKRNRARAQLHMKEILKEGKGKRSVPRVMLTPQEALRAEIHRANNPIKALNNIKHFVMLGGRLDMRPSGAYGKLVKKAEKAGLDIHAADLYSKFSISDASLLEFEYDRIAHMWNRKFDPVLAKNFLYSAVETTKNIIKRRHQKQGQ